MLRERRQAYNVQYVVWSVQFWTRDRWCVCNHIGCVSWCIIWLLNRYSLFMRVKTCQQADWLMLLPANFGTRMEHTFAGICMHPEWRWDFLSIGLSLEGNHAWLKQVKKTTISSFLDNFSFVRHSATQLGFLPLTPVVCLAFPCHQGCESLGEQSFGSGEDGQTVPRLSHDHSKRNLFILIELFWLAIELFFPRSMG